MKSLICTLASIGLLLTAHGSGTLYPHGDVFPIGGYIPTPERDLAAGFTLAGPSYGSQNADTVLAECERLGMPFIYPVGMTKSQVRSSPSVTEAEIRATITAQVARVAASEVIYAWYLNPEELRYWYPNEMEYLRVASDAVRQADPYKRPVWMYEPGHRRHDALAHTFPYQQIAGKGMYTNYAGRQDERIWVRWTFGEQQRAIDEANPGMLAFAVPEMFQQPDENSLPLVRRWVRHDSYTSLLEGAEGMVIFSFSRRSGFHARQAYYDAYAEVATELNGELQLGTVFLRGEPQDVPGYEHLSGPEQAGFQLTGSAPEAISLPSLKAKAITWGGETYLFVVNSSPEAVAIRFQDPLAVQALLSGQPQLGTDGRTLELGAWEVVAFKILPLQPQGL